MRAGTIEVGSGFRGGLMMGVRCIQELQNGSRPSPQRVGRMRADQSRHRVAKRPDTRKNREE